MITTAAFDVALASPRPRMGIFLRFHIDPVFRLWLGVGDCEADIDATDTGGAIYSGLGELQNLPAFQQLINGAADRITFTLSRVSQRVAQLAASEADDVKGATLMTGFGLFDKDWQIVDSPVWLKRLTVDYLSVQRMDGEQGAEWTVALSARTFLTGRRRPGLSFWTDSDQQSRFPGDRFCERAATHNAFMNKAWPRF